MFIELFPYNIDHRKIVELVEILKKGGVLVIPTDSVYSFACDLHSKTGMEKLAALKNIKLSKARFSLVCSDLTNISEYTKPLERKVYKALNKALPGPYTFILHASNQVPKLFGNKRKEIGIRVPANEVALEITRTLGNPLVVASIHDEDEFLEYSADPMAIFERFENKVDAVVDAGYGNLEPSTIIDCTSGEIEVIREGIGDVDLLT